MCVDGAEAAVRESPRMQKILRQRSKKRRNSLWWEKSTLPSIVAGGMKEKCVQMGPRLDIWWGKVTESENYYLLSHSRDELSLR